MACGRTVSIVKSNVNNAGSSISVDVEKSRGGGGSSGSVSSLFNGEWLEVRGSAVDFVVDLSDGIQSSGPSARNGFSSNVLRSNSGIGN
jgi:ferredoxin-NADP reductase